MYIGNKIIVFIVGICIPIMIAASFCLNLWFDGEVVSLRGYAVSKELESIEDIVNNELQLLGAVASIYAAPIKSQVLDDVRQNNALLNGINIFFWNHGLITPQLEQDKQLALVLPDIPEHLLNNTELVSGAYFDALHETAYFISVKPFSADKAVIAVKVIKDNYLALRGLPGFVNLARMELGYASDGIIFNGQNIQVDLALPAFNEELPVYVNVTFSNGFFARLSSQYSWMAAGMLCLVMLLQLVTYLWLKFGFVKPFYTLTEQLISINPMAKNYKPLTVEGGAELSILTRRINGLLARIYRQEMRSKITLESIAEAVILTDINAKVVYINAYAERLLKVKSAKALGESPQVLLRAGDQFNNDLSEFMQSGASLPEFTQIVLNIDALKVMERSVNNLRNHNGQVVGVVIVLRDITQEAKLKQQLQRRANYDQVTGLLNRSAFEDKLETLAQNANSIAVVYLDLEQFKLINDSCGHNAGDKMLYLVAKAIESNLSSDHLLARLGGDEFGLAIKDTSALNIAKLLKSIINNVSMQVMHHQQEHYRVGVSVGVSYRRQQKKDVLEMIKDADIACLAAKRKGCNQIHFYDDSDQELCYQRNAPKWAMRIAPKWAMRIAQAIEHNELILYYQKIEQLSSQYQRKRLEVLLRIQEPCGRILPPAQFIAAAERFKLMTEVDKEVIRKTFLWLSLREELWQDHSLSINLSGNSLGAEGMVNYILQQQARFNIPSCCICFEITETSAIQNHSRAMDMLQQLRKRGFSFALDDFGSGFASYGYLKEMPVDYVKIDGCFVKSLTTNAKDYAIVKSIHDVCRVMGIETVAEFVETQEIIVKLKLIGVNYAQGYAIGRPQALESYQPINALQQRSA
ncbi:EAL domain-containing protein [Shewanella gelidimarina]|uniref:putative bifunctional diguanylate cyclase/phosphodiesterase n=1 Tax=Shewanella gelidimarina TaxID=56813 RepID=UPI00200CB68F|nr:EAL domain-containing protein [Shewanella gelidimarina]MCL1056631.1 EAL domain-containing protein [Shewanella gelidimarina]